MLTHRSCFLLAAGMLFAAGCSDHKATPVTADAPPEERTAAPVVPAEIKPIPGAYIVVLKDAEPEASAPGSANLSLEAVGARLQSVTASVEVEPRYIFESINGFAAQLSTSQLEELRQDPRVEYIEQDQEVSVQGTQSLDDNRYGDPWGIDRLDQRHLRLSKTYSYRYTGDGVYAYIIDSGLDSGHPQFEGRARNDYDARGGNGKDCNGHGTHIAGTIGAKKWGVAKKVRLRGIRVLDCNAVGWVSDIIEGIDWVRKNRRNPAVASISIGAGYSKALNKAVDDLAKSGVFVAVSASNNSTDACKYSPASAKEAFTTAASTGSDSRASYSNYGKCVDGYAPGTWIMSTWKGGGTKLMSGTSMAAPHVAALAALYKDKYGNASSKTIDRWIKSKATRDVIRGNKSGTPNLLVYKYGL